MNDHPATGAREVVPSDSADIFTNPSLDARALWVGVTGNITLKMHDGSIVLFANVPVGVFPIQCRRVMATGTTATGIVALL